MEEKKRRDHVCISFRVKKNIFIFINFYLIKLAHNQISNQPEKEIK
jgi:hypothetical protein